MKYYLDTCIWLNLFKKEVIAGKELDKITEEFISTIIKNKEHIYYSGIILKESRFKLDKDSLKQMQTLIESDKNFIYTKLTREDYEFARTLEKRYSFKIGFCDCLHIAVSKRNNFILVTRDKDMTYIGKKYVIIDIPENLHKPT